MEKIHPETGEVLHRDVRPFEFTFRGEKVIIDMPGWYNDKGDDGIFTQEDMKIAGNALRIMKARHKQKSQENNFELGDVALA